MEGKTSKYSISAWRKNAKEKRNISKREYYKKSEEKLAEKARERVKRLRDHAHNALWVMYIILNFCPFLGLKNYKIVL